MSKKDYRIINKWKKDMYKILKLSYPNASKEDIEKFIDNELKENIVVEKGVINDNYRRKIYNTNTLDVTEFYYKEKPITTEHGVLFNNSKNEYNPAAKMLEIFADNRKEFKRKRNESPRDSYDYKQNDLFQLLEKIKSNAWYGVSGTGCSLFFNLFCALSVTGKGQTLISTAMMAFESFISNNVLFRNNDECIQFILNVVKERKKRKYNLSDYIDNYATKYDVFSKLLNTYENKSMCDETLIMPILDNLDKEELNRIFYKNNLFGFCLNNKIKKLLRETILITESFTNPNEPPEESVLLLEELWDLMKEFVFYNYPIIDRVYRLKTQKRKAVIIIDTDSNMINMEPWYNFIFDQIVDKNELKNKNDDDVRYIIIYILAYILGEMIRATLKKYLKTCNVEKEKMKILDMKNEYLFSRVLITTGKKNYASAIEFKEGKYMADKLDVKGLPINKSNLNKNASKIFKSILHNDILKAKKIEIPIILNKLNAFESVIRESLESGSKDYLIPKSVKDESAYKDPLSEMTIRAIMNWNICYPDLEIVPPENVLVTKTNLIKKSQLEKIKDSEPEIYERVNEYIFNNPEKRIKSKGLYVVAIPLDMDRVPDWLIEFIDVDTIIKDTFNPMIKILNSLGLETLRISSSDTLYGNIISL